MNFNELKGSSRRKPSSSSSQLEETVARKLCVIAEVDPDEKYFPVHPSHQNIYFPMWQRLRIPAQEIIALVQTAKMLVNEDA